MHTADDLVRLVEALPAECRPMVHLGAVLGLRWGECAGLRVGRLDFFARTLTVAEQRTRARREPWSMDPQVSSGHRTLSMRGPLSDLLAEHLAARQLTGADGDAHVLVTPEGHPLEYSGWCQRAWLPACRAPGSRASDSTT